MRVVLLYDIGFIAVNYEVLGPAVRPFGAELAVGFRFTAVAAIKNDRQGSRGDKVGTAVEKVL